MNWQHTALCACALLALPALASGAKNDGVAVEDMSTLRKLVPEAELEAEAARQYQEARQQASRHKALAPADHPQLRRLNAIADKLIPHALRWNPRAGEWKWEISLIGTAEINAYCLPGGKIVFFSGLLDQLKLTDDEVAIVMGHEIAHALREHGRERLAKSGLAGAGAKIAGIGLSAIFGVDPRLADAASNGAASLTMLKFSRDDESEADAVGLDIVARAGYDPRAGIALWRKMDMAGSNAQGGAVPATLQQWLSTHPSGKHRIAGIQKQLPAVMPLYAKARGAALSSLPPYRSNHDRITPIHR